MFFIASTCSQNQQWIFLRMDMVSYIHISHLMPKLFVKEDIHGHIRYGMCSIGEVGCWRGMEVECAHICSCQPIVCKTGYTWGTISRWGHNLASIQSAPTGFCLIIASSDNCKLWAAEIRNMFLIKGLKWAAPIRVPLALYYTAIASLLLPHNSAILIHTTLSKHSTIVIRLNVWPD